MRLWICSTVVIIGLCVLSLALQGQVHRVSEPIPAIDTTAIPPPDSLIAVESEPTFEVFEVQKTLRYPELARRNGIQGKVIVLVFVDAYGRAVRTRIESSDNKLLESEAVRVVSALHYTPAISNGKPIGCWLTFPVTFTMRY